MPITVKSQDYMAGSTKILVFPDHFVAVPHTFPQNDAAAVTQPTGRKVIPQGTVYPANDGTALGVVFHDVDVTDGDQTMALLIHGFLKKAALPADISTAARAVLPMLAVLPLNDNPNP